VKDTNNHFYSHRQIHYHENANSHKNTSIGISDNSQQNRRAYDVPQQKLTHIYKLQQSPLIFQTLALLADELLGIYRNVIDST